ncbi:Polyadenylate-binding protein-interacting protein 2B [Holothuria leucospilota]|uniref:Polyadenylate-binding protein-interacting protein 2B n=1 Tax=Holothuria leucospilota TaxID=206669 RepID=A0A9Q0YPD6_HOLLE|nr:Polyadenylate-binding protein-interacting protein 2B [Holothuria leucospilota]
MDSSSEAALDPFADYMWMEEQEAFDQKVIEELLEEEQIEEDFEDMMAEEGYHFFNSLQLSQEIEMNGSQIPDVNGTPSRPHSNQYSAVELAGSNPSSTVIPRTEEQIPWSNGINEKSADVSSDSDSEGGGPQR